MTSSTVGLSVGVTAAIGALVYAAILLLQVEGASSKALVAVWLWALPVLGIGALLGWLAGRAIGGLINRGAGR